MARGQETGGLKEFIKERLDGKGKKQAVSLRLTQRDLEALDAICKQSGIKRQDAMENAIQDWIKEAQKTLAPPPAPCKHSDDCPMDNCSAGPDTSCGGYKPKEVTA